MDYAKLQIEKFFRYLAIPSQSDPAVSVLPSSQGQLELARLLKRECEDLGLAEIVLDEQAILTAKLPANLPGKAPGKSLGFIAHLDTVDVGLSPVIRPQILNFTGSPLILNAARGIICDPALHPELQKYLGEELIFGDGTSVLGADNKAAIATIMTLAEFLVRERPAHPELCLAFVPDEEIGLRGSKALDLARFAPDLAFTIDACELGELNVETFNAAQAEVKIIGIPAHPMSAKGVLVNPSLVALDLASGLNRLETPENTQEREGYIWLHEIHSNQAEARLLLNIRDFEEAGFEARKNYVRELARLTQLRHPRAKISCQIKDQYKNPASSPAAAHSQAFELLRQAFAHCGIEPKLFAMRGGTDGSALAERGLCVPNFFTGAHNFHSPFEFLPVRAFFKSFEVARALAELAVAD